jgi:hypothetical protein
MRSKIKNPCNLDPLFLQEFDEHFRSKYDPVYKSDYLVEILRSMGFDSRTIWSRILNGDRVQSTLTIRSDIILNNDDDYQDWVYALLSWMFAENGFIPSPEVAALRVFSTACVRWLNFKLALDEPLPTAPLSPVPYKPEAPPTKRGRPRKNPIQ